MKIKMKKQIKLSENQEIVVRLLQTGDWELGFYTGMLPNVAIQKGGLGRGGKRLNVKLGTFDSLRKKGVIEYKNVSSLLLFCTKYRLTELGKLYTPVHDLDLSNW